MPSASRTAPPAEPPVRPRPGRARTAIRRRVTRLLFEEGPSFNYTKAPGPPSRAGGGLDGVPGDDGIPHDDGEPPPVYCLIGRFRPFFDSHDHNLKDLLASAARHRTALVRRRCRW